MKFNWVLLLLVFGAGTALQAHPEAGQVDMVREVQQRTEALREYQKQRRQVLDQLYQIQQTMKGIARTQSEISSRSQRMRVELEKSEESFNELRAELKVLRQKLGRAALNLSQVDASSMARMLFAADSPAQLDRSLKFFGLLIEREMKTLKAYQEQGEQIRQKSAEIQQVLAEIEASEFEMLDSERALKAEHSSKLKLIADLDRRRKQEVESLRKLRLTSLGKLANQLEGDEQLQKLLRPSFFEQQGQLLSPLGGDVRGAYGLHRDPELQTELSLSGWFIAAKDSPEVQAPYGGRVAVVHTGGRLKSIVLLDHGHDYYTSYAGLSQVQVEEGEWVEQGQVLGLASYSQRWQAEGVHFEIRHFSEAQDPARWVKAAVQQQASLKN